MKITIKADKSPVTDGDLAVDEILKNKIKEINTSKVSRNFLFICLVIFILEIKNKFQLLLK